MRFPNAAGFEVVENDGVVGFIESSLYYRSLAHVELGRAEGMTGLVLMTVMQGASDV